MPNNSSIPSDLPAFHKIDPATIEAELDQLLAENCNQIAALLSNLSSYSWDELMLPLAVISDRLDKFWSPISHLHGVKQTPELRETYNNCLPKLITYTTAISQNEKLYQAIKKLAESPTYAQLEPAQKKLIQNELRDFHLAGVGLTANVKERYAEIQNRLAKLTTEFEENVLDATESWTYHVTDHNELKNIPKHTLIAAQEAAQAKNLTGWLLTLEYPCYHSVLSYAANRSLREKMYHAYVTRASDQSPTDDKFDNGPIMAEILQLRHELSTLLAFNNFAERSLATKMMQQPQQVLDFLQQLVNYARPKAQQELEELTEFALKQDGITTLQAWDIAYYSERLQHQNYGIDDEVLRPYFPIEQVLTGLFALTERLYSMRITEIKNIDTWHPDVRFFEIRDHQQQLRGQFYLDLYARHQKREGAWMDECLTRWRLPNNTIQTPVVYLICNLTPPNQDKPALLTHNEVLTIFHEFGHGLHHMLTTVDYFGISGINGVAWDAVELPSQFMECFAWEKPVLDMISQHYKTGEALPEKLLQSLRAAKNFHAGLHLVRQLEFALFDFKLHLNNNQNITPAQIQKILEEIRATTTVISAPTFNRFQNSFGHIFSGGYAAGYYSYLWAEMLSSDAFAKFLENGIFDYETGEAFLHNILEQGGSKEALDLFIQFRGRAPKIDALLKQYGITR